ncbi:MAG TPA: hypothetical protein VGD78_15200 [Chthoniobacterales bacterium]
MVLPSFKWALVISKCLYGFKYIGTTEDPTFFGNAIVTFSSPSTSIRAVLDRGQIFIEARFAEIESKWRDIQYLLAARDSVEKEFDSQEALGHQASLARKRMQPIGPWLDPMDMGAFLQTVGLGRMDTAQAQHLEKLMEQMEEQESRATAKRIFGRLTVASC